MAIFFILIQQQVRVKIAKNVGKHKDYEKRIRKSHKIINSIFRESQLELERREKIKIKIRIKIIP